LAQDLDSSEILSAITSGSADEGPSVQFRAGRTFGNYELLEEIARGGMGIVYRARQVGLDRIVAVKMLLAGPLAGKDFVQRFRTEASAAASLQHPNIVAIHEVGFAEGQHFFAMEFVEGLTLAQLVAKGPLPARQAANYLKTIAQAIHFAHERNVLHRDLKPSNILIDSATDQPSVTDFGLAKRLESETDLTLSGQVLGSPNFMSPEQATAKRGAVGKHSDVYSLGAILYYSLTGRPPFQGETLTDVLQQVANDDPLAPNLLTPGVPHDLETICLKCLEKEPSARYQTAQELADELNRFLRDEPIEARPVSPLEKAWRWCRRKPALASSLSLIIILILILIIGSPLAAYRINEARKAETKQRERAEDNREHADQNLYDSDMSLAQHAWDEGDLGRTLSLIEAHRPQAGEKDRRSFEWYYFRNLCEGDQRMTLRGHRNAVTCVAFSPDGKLLATGSVGDPVQIWDSATGKLIKTLPEQNVLSLSFAPDGQSLGVGGQDQASVWSLETGRAVFTREEALGLFRIAFSPLGTSVVIGKHGLDLGSDGGSAQLWDYLRRKWKHEFPESGGHVVISPKGDRLATGNWNGALKIWDLVTGQLVRSLNTGPVIAAAFSPDGQTFATSAWGPQVELWDLKNGHALGSLTNNQHRVWSLAFSPDGRFLATGGADQLVRVWDIATLQQTEQLQGHGNEVLSVSFSSDGQTLASGSKDKTAMLWNLHPQRTVTAVSNVISRPIFSPDGRWVAAGIGQNKVAAWDVATLEVKVVFAGAYDAVAFAPDSRSLLTRGSNYLLRTFDVTTRAVRETIPGRPAEESDSFAGLSPDGRVLVASLNDASLIFSDASTGVALATNVLQYPSVCAFSPNGKFLATTVAPNMVTNRFGATIWDMVTHKAVAVLAGHTDWVLSAAFCPDGKILATCGADNSIRFWDTLTWKETPPALGHKEYITCLAFSPNGRTLVSTSADRTMKFWNAVTRRELASLKLDAEAMNIAFSPDGQTLAVRNWDGSLHLWRAPVLPDPKRILSHGLGSKAELQL
jgi:WD40 repeat protein